MRQRSISNASMEAQLPHLSIQGVVEHINGEADFASPHGETLFSQHTLLEMFIQQYHTLLRTYVLSLLGEYDAAQDIIQETWIALYAYIQKHPSSWSKEANIPGLLRTIARRKVINYMKVQQRVTSLDSGNATFIFEPHVPPFDYPENTAMRDDVCLVLYQAVNTLCKSQHDVIALRYFYDCSLEDIASTLQMPLNTVKSHLRRGQQQLEKLLDDNGINRNDIGLWDKTQESFPKAILRE